MSDQTSIAREESARAELAVKLTAYHLLQAGVLLGVAETLPANVIAAALSLLAESGPQKFRRSCSVCGRAIAQTETARFAKGASFGGVGAINVCVRGKRGTQGTVKDGCYEGMQQALAQRALASIGLTIQ